MVLPAPPSPRSFPLIGEALAYQRDPLALLTRLMHTYGDIAGFHLGPLRACLIGHPDDVYRVLVSEARKFPKPRFLHQITGRFFGDGLITSDGDLWRRQRKLMQPAFHHQHLTGYAETMVEFAMRVRDAWQPGQAVDMDRAMHALTMQIVAKTLFNADADAEADAVYAAIEVFQEMLAQINPLIPPWLPTAHNRREAAAVRMLDRIVLRFIAEHRTSAASTGDLLSLLLEARDEEGQAMSDRQVRDEAITLLVAGHETTASVLTWAWYALATQPDVAAAVHAELDAALQGAAPTLADLPQFTYIDNFIKEILRMYPPAWQTQREAAEEVVIRGYRIKRGTTVFLSPYLMHHDPRWWDAPEAFRPERFAEEQKSAIHPHTYWPFGAGMRMCIGQQFALMEAKLVLATLAQRYTFELAPDARIGIKSGATLVTMAGMPMICRQRLPDAALAL